MQIAACEALHSIILLMVGIGESAHFAKLYARLFPGMLAKWQTESAN